MPKKWMTPKEAKAKEKAYSKAKAAFKKGSQAHRKREKANVNPKRLHDKQDLLTNKPKGQYTQDQKLNARADAAKIQASREGKDVKIGYLDRTQRLPRARPAAKRTNIRTDVEPMPQFEYSKGDSDRARVRNRIRHGKTPYTSDVEIPGDFVWIE